MVWEVEYQLAENVTEAKREPKEFPTTSNITKKKEPNIFSEYLLDFQTLSIVTIIELSLFPFYTCTKYK